MAGELEFLVPPGVPAPRATYSHAVRVRSGDPVVLAGQVPIDEQGKTVGIGDIAAQTQKVIDNIRGVLQGVGGSFDDVVKYTVYVVGRDAATGFRDERARLWPELHSSGRYPASTLVVVDGLASPEFLIEIEVLATV